MLKAVEDPTELEDLVSRDHSLNGGILFGIDGYVIELQARAMKVRRNPISWRVATSVTGMARGALAESLARIEGAFSKLRIPDPQVEILINLAPADLPKEGAWLDLPLAIIMLQAAGMLPDLPESMEGDYVLMGELGIHAEVRRVPGALSLAYEAKPGQKLLVPYGNEKECCLILAKPGHEGCGVMAVSTLDEAIDFFRGKKKLQSALQGKLKFENAIPKSVDFGKIKGQEKAKRAAMISAAGGHNMLMIGPPGEGKSLLAGAIPGILPRLNDEEKVILTKIYSACGQLENDGTAVTRRPFRPIHHSTSPQALVGGGSKIARPGEITLSHLGVLFLDEIAEFSRSTLESLRQPIESGEVHISRVSATMRYPSRFTLVAAMNPCPCGYYGTEKCRCETREVKKYLQKLSGPIIDRIDLQVQLQSLSLDERFAKTSDNESPKIRKRVEKARQLQDERFKGTDIPYNSAIPGGHVADYTDFSDIAMDVYKKIVEENSLSTRSIDRLAKVSRTIADLDDSTVVLDDHVLEAKEFVVGGMLRELF